MVPAFGMVILSQSRSTGNEKIPGCSCILSVDYYYYVLVVVVAHRVVAFATLCGWAGYPRVYLRTQIELQPAEYCLVKLEMPGSWQWPEKSRAIWHGADAYHGVFIPETYY